MLICLRRAIERFRLSVGELAGLRALGENKGGFFVQPNQLRGGNSSVVVDQGEKNLANPWRKWYQGLNHAFGGSRSFFVHLPSLSDRSQRRMGRFTACPPEVNA